RAAALVLLAACHSSSPQPMPMEASVPDACAAIAISRTTADAGILPRGIGECIPTKSGAWGLIVIDPDPHFTGVVLGYELRVVHAAGATVVVRGDTFSFHEPPKATLFDFDGDGEPELVLEGKDHFSRTTGDLLPPDYPPVAYVFSFTKGSVEKYALLGAGFYFLGRAVDVDSDGRPDFETHLRYAIYASDSDVGSIRLDGPTFVAHSLSNGLFSVDDTVALAALARSCAAAGPIANARGSGLVETAVCARLKGESVAAVRRKYDARCAILLGRIPIAAGGTARIVDLDARSGADADLADIYVRCACRVETEGGASGAHGMPASLDEMLADTAPVLLRTKNDAGGKP
ncbi:MAG: hypothetical protein ABI551_04130, partial [Polyangiaceae bacterium]